MYEALRSKSISVYIHDDAWLSYKEVLDWSKLAVLVHIDNIDTLYNRLKGISDEQITEMLDYYHSVEHYFTYDGMCEYVLDKSKIIFSFHFLFTCYFANFLFLRTVGSNQNIRQAEGKTVQPIANHVKKQVSFSNIASTNLNVLITTIIFTE